MNLCIINGSHRSNSESLRVSRIISEKKVVSDNFNQVSLLDLNSLNLPLWNEGVWDGADEWLCWQEPAKQLQDCDALIIVMPEWGGMVPPGLKNLLLLAGPEEVGHKPALLVSVSAGRGGVNPINEMRSTAYKNNHICYLPDHIILRDVESLFYQDDESSDYYSNAIDYHVTLLSEYSKSLIQVRKSGCINNNEYRYGMS